MDSTIRINVEDYLSGKIKKVFNVGEINDAWALLSALTSYFLRGGNSTSNDMNANRIEACKKIVKYLASSNPFTNMNEFVRYLLQDIYVYDKKAFEGAMRNLKQAEMASIYSHILFLLKTKDQLLTGA